MENKATVRDTDLMANFKTGFDEGRPEAKVGEALFDLVVFRATKKLEEFRGCSYSVVIDRISSLLERRDAVYSFEVTPVGREEVTGPVSDDDVVDAEVVED